MIRRMQPTHTWGSLFRLMSEGCPAQSGPSRGPRGSSVILFAPYTGITLPCAECVSQGPHSMDEICAYHNAAPGWARPYCPDRVTDPDD